MPDDERIYLLLLRRLKISSNDDNLFHQDHWGFLDNLNIQKPYVCIGLTWIFLRLNIGWTWWLNKLMHSSLRRLPSDVEQYFAPIWFVLYHQLKKNSATSSTAVHIQICKWNVDEMKTPFFPRMIDYDSDIESLSPSCQSVFKHADRSHFTANRSFCTR